MTTRTPKPSFLPLPRRASLPTKNFRTFSPHQTTAADPVEVVQARSVAITQICAELVATVFCSSQWCITTPCVAVLSASPVACCSKLGVTYTLWCCIGVLLCVIHAVTAAQAVIHEAHNYFWPPIVLSFAQILLCVVSLLVVYCGWKAASATRRPVHPIEMPSELPMQSPVRSVAETQLIQHSQVSRMLP